MYELTKLFTASFVSLFTIVDPICAAPIFVSVTSGDTLQKKNRQALKAILYMLAILLAFLFAGSMILKFFGLSIEGIKIAGGLMMINSAKAMLDEKKKLTKSEHNESLVKDDVAFSPIAMPLLAGPGAIAVTIGMSAHAKEPSHYFTILLAILMVAIISYIILRLSSTIVNKMSATSINAMTKMMGFIVLCIGVQFILDGLVSVYSTKIK